MMKGIKTLIKLHKRTLDELRRKMISLENQKNQLLQASSKLQEELQREVDIAGKRPDMAQFFGDFAKRIKARQEQLAEEVRIIDKQIVKLSDEVAAAYSEVKKFEIAESNAEKRAEREVNRKETIELDEIAGQQHRRRHEDTGAA
jgi:flagellar protein FliJ